VRLLVASDLHYDLRKLDWLLSEAGGFDLVALSGDLLDISSPVPLQAQIEVTRRYLEQLAERTEVAVCSGNHDLDHRRDDGEKATAWLQRTTSPRLHVDGANVLLDDTLVSVLGWWEGPNTQAALRTQLADAAGLERARWVWLYHSPPEGLLSWTGSRHFGDDVAAELVAEHQPDVVLCGHIHQSPFTPEGSWHERRGPTRLFNAGRQQGAVPSHIAIDLAAGEARWWSIGAEETVQLTD
jgi:Icc-related predicted phosphoesterase